MPLTDFAIKSLQPMPSRYTVTDRNGLTMEIYPTGGKVWRYRYRHDGKSETVTIGKYPTISLRSARERRDALAVDVSRGISPAKQKQASRRALGEASTVQEFAERYVVEVVAKARKSVAQVKNDLERDIYPLIGDMPIRQVAAEHCRHVIWAKKSAGFDAAAGNIRGLLKRLLDYAVTLGALPANPIAAIPMRHVHRARARDRALSPEEVKILSKALVTSSQPRPILTARTSSFLE